MRAGCSLRAGKAGAMGDSGTGCVFTSGVLSCWVGSEPGGQSQGLVMSEEMSLVQGLAGGSR